MITEELIQGQIGKPPLVVFPWKHEAEKLMLWAKARGPLYHAFVFDLLMSLAYVDTIPSLQKYIERYTGLHREYNSHLGFINLCVPRLLNQSEWCYQKAAKPQSGVIGKLTSEIMLKCVEVYFDKLIEVRSVGGAGLVDGVLLHNDGRIVLCEVKAAPLTTFPFLFSIPEEFGHPISLTRTQLESVDSALYMHSEEVIPLGRASDSLWPFAAVADFITGAANQKMVQGFVHRWDQIRAAYKEKDKSSLLFFVANASGLPPRIAKEQFDWPGKESVSDSKTSAGLDRTDDIKKGIYQTFKLGIESKKKFPEHNIKTAIISNLPAYRHGSEYIEPFFDVYWGLESAFQDEPHGGYVCQRHELSRPFDLIITLDGVYTKGESL